MLGDTSMGMINGYFGPRRLAPIGFSEHKVDQAWIIDRGRSISDDRLNGAMAFVKESGVRFHWGEDGADDFDENATREQLRDYLTVLDLVSEFKADCVGWQYQLGLVPLRPPSDFAEGLLNSVCRPESNGDVIITVHGGRSRQPRPHGADEAATQGQGAAPGGDVPRCALGRANIRDDSCGCCSTRARAEGTP